MTTFPRNPAVSLRLCFLALDLQSITTQGPVADTIRVTAKSNPKACIKMVREMATDAYTETCDVVGYKLVDKILEL
jgi:hypothetical protein